MKTNFYRKFLHALSGLMLCVCVCVCVNPAWAQTFNKTYSDQKRITNHNTVVTATDNPNEYVVAGTVSEISDSTKTDIRVTRFKNDGTVIWQKTYNITDQDRCYHINNADDGYIITGSVLDPNDVESLYLLRINNVGGKIDEKIYDTDPIPYLSEMNQGLSVIQTSAGGFAVVGFGMNRFYSQYSTNFKQGFFVQTDAQLNPIPSQSALIDSVMADHVLEVPGTGFFITGTIDEFIKGQNYIAAVMLDYNGAPIWQKKFAIKNLTENGAHAVFDPSTRHIYLLSNIETQQEFAITKIDLNGQIKKVIDFERSPLHNPIFGFDLKVSPNDTANLIVTGYFKQQTTSSTYYDNALFATELNKNSGNYVWKKTYPVGARYYGMADFTSTTGLFAIFPNAYQMPYAYTPAISAITPSNELIMVTYRSKQYPKPNNYDLTVVKAGATNGNSDCDNNTFIFPIPIVAGYAQRNDIIVKSLDDLPSIDQSASINSDNDFKEYTCQEYACGTPSIQFSLQGCTYQFSSTLTGSGNAIGWQWNFGDGTTSALQNPNHTFNSIGNVNVCLTITSKTINGETCVTTICRQIYIDCFGSGSRQNSSFQSTVFPVPTNGKTNIKLSLSQPENVEITALDLLVEHPVSTIFKQNKLNAGIHEIIWQPASEVPAGIYMIKVKVGEKIQMHKIILLR